MASSINRKFKTKGNKKRIQVNYKLKSEPMVTREFCCFAGVVIIDMGWLKVKLNLNMLRKIHHSLHKTSLCKEIMGKSIHFDSDWNLSFMVLSKFTKLNEPVY